ncbi:MAG: DoxX family protein [Bacteroidota bacterium]
MLDADRSSDDRLDRRLAYGVLRLTLGVNILLHGLVRVGNLGGFADGLAEGFSETILPAPLVRLSAYGIVIAEVGIGALLTVGLWTRWALVAGGLLMTVLVFGTALRQDWGTLGSQMVYAFLYFALLFARTYDYYSLDQLRRR